jgi:hypothetical protein
VPLENHEVSSGLKLYLLHILSGCSFFFLKHCRQWQNWPLCGQGRAERAWGAEWRWVDFELFEARVERVREAGLHAGSKGIACYHLLSLTAGLLQTWFPFSVIPLGECATARRKKFSA